MKLFLETAGWWGAALVLTAYALVNFSVLSVENIWYPILNSVGSIGILMISLYKRAYQPAVVNAIWAAVAVISIIRFFS